MHENKAVTEWIKKGVAGSQWEWCAYEHKLLHCFSASYSDAKMWLSIITTDSGLRLGFTY